MNKALIVLIIFLSLLLNGCFYTYRIPYSEEFWTLAIGGTPSERLVLVETDRNGEVFFDGRDFINSLRLRPASNNKYYAWCNSFSEPFGTSSGTGQNFDILQAVFVSTSQDGVYFLAIERGYRGENNRCRSGNAVVFYWFRAVQRGDVTDIFATPRIDQDLQYELEDAFDPTGNEELFDDGYARNGRELNFLFGYASEENLWNYVGSFRTYDLSIRSERRAYESLVQEAAEQ